MKVLLLLYSDLLKEGEEKLYSRLEKNLRLINKVIGIDNIYAAVSAPFKDLFEKFPDLCFINNVKDSSVFGAYKGLRKLRGNDVLIIDGGVKLEKEHLFQFFNRINVTVGMIKEKWSGIAFVKMRDVDYMIRSLERNFEKGMLDAFRTLKETYSIAADFIDLKGGLKAPILELK